MQKSKLQFKTQNYFTVFLISFVLALIPLQIFAAEVSINAEGRKINVGEQLEIGIFLNTEGEYINAVEGKVIFPGDLLQLKEIRDGATIVNFWIERPKVRSDNQIIFSGIIPGGYMDEKGLIFSAVFQSKNEGGGTIEIREVKTLLNDGKGTESGITTSNLQLLISKEVPSSQISPTKIIDTDPPEPFELMVGQDPGIFDGKYFLVFADQDKGSGIDHYEILEDGQRGSLQKLIREEKWQSGESPYLLRDQELKSYIYVKAIDKAGNERIASLSSQNPLKWYENYFTLLTILITIIIAYIIWRCVKRFGFGKLSLLGITLAIVSLALPVSVFAASLYLSPATGSYNVGQTFSVSVYVSSADQAINAASGVISFPSDKLEVISLSKSGTIFNLWVQEPTFSNSTGTVIFEGIVLNSGFIGSAGKIITVNLKTKAVGTIPLIFSSGSVLANDGKGTNILASMVSGAYTISPTIITPPLAGTPSAPEIISLTHPEPEKWYSNNNPEFSWKLPPDVTGVSLLLHKSPTANPGLISNGKIESKKFEDVENGIWYFHIKFQNQYGWGGITHRKVLIDTEFPNPFEIKADNGGDPTNPSLILYFNTTDSLSGIEYYEVKIGEGNIFAFKPEEMASNPFRIPPQSPGKHTVIVKAVDKAGNSILAMEETNILPIETPKITNWPKSITPEAVFSIKGTSSPKNLINIYLEENGTIQKFTTKTDENGDWEYIFIIESLKEGVHYIWAEAVNEKGALSSHSEKISFLVQAPAFFRIGNLAVNYLTFVVVLIGLVALIVFGTSFIWYKFKRFLNSLRKETKEAKETTLRAFNALRKEIRKQIEYFDKKPGLTEEEKAIHDKLQEALNISEKFIGKEIKDIERKLE